MSPLTFALRRPITVMVALAGLIVGSGLALWRMKIDIFPNLNLPVVYVVQPYGGMDPAQMEALLTFHYENHFLYISGIHHIESRNIQGFSQMKIFFHPGTDMVQALSEVVAQVNRARSFMPPGTVAPFVVRFDAGSAPVGYLVLESKSKTIDEIQEAAYIRVRPTLVSLQGVSAPPPFGGNQRTIVLHVDPDRLRAYSLSPDDVVSALTAGNSISPSGNSRIQGYLQIVPTNAMVANPQDLGNIPLKPGRNVYIRDVVAPAGGIEDGTDIPTSFALVNGRRAVYMLVSKRADASTLAVVNRVKEAMPKMQASLPEEIKLRFEFDQSPYVTRAMEGVASEGALGAILTGLMVLLFLRDWRSVIVVVLNIPFALLAAIVALWATGQTLNLMTLGGLALAVGILVDEATVAVENIHTHSAKSDNLALAVWHGTQETTVPRLLAMLCVLAVFLPAAFMEGAARELFVPLSLAVGFSMMASYLLSSTFVPVLSVWLLKQHKHHEHEPVAKPGRFSFERLKERYGHILREGVIRRRKVLLPAYLILATLVVLILGPRCGTEIFPNVDSGQFQIRVKAPVGTRIERTEEIAQETLRVIGDVAGRDNVDLSVVYGGVSPSSYTINTVYLWTGGPEEAVLRVALRKEAGLRVEKLKKILRQELPKRVGERLRGILADEGKRPDQVEAGVAQLRFGFEPADIVNEVMSFGSPTPIEVAISGPDFAASRAFATKVYDQLAQVPALCDLQNVQSLNYPTVEVRVDRERAGLSGVTTADVARALVSATSSSRFVVPNYWRDPKNGVGYQVQVEIPTHDIESSSAIAMVPVQERKGRTARAGRGQRGREHHAGRIRPLQHAPRGEHDGQLERGRLGACGPAGSGRHPPGGRTAARRDGRRAWSDDPPDADVSGFGIRARNGRGRDLPVIDGLFSVAADGGNRRFGGAGGTRRRRVRTLGDEHHAQHPVVHGCDHGGRRRRRQCDSVAHVCRTGADAGIRSANGRHLRRHEPIAAHSDDQLRHARRHGADGFGHGRRGRANGSARPCGDRGAGGGDGGDALHSAGGLCRRAAAGLAPVGVAGSLRSVGEIFDRECPESADRVKQSGS